MSAPAMIPMNGYRFRILSPRVIGKCSPIFILASPGEKTTGLSQSWYQFDLGIFRR
jgi:hypothetical protein